MANKVYEEVLDFDFGFSFIDEEIQEKQAEAEKAIQKVSSEKETLEEELTDYQLAVDDLQNRLSLLYNSISPFLDNLCKNPEKSTIYWPDRVAKIEAYKTKLLSIVEGA
jgi:DNA repair exonuclease SbcCD ATPase subunit